MGAATLPANAMVYGIAGESLLVHRAERYAARHRGTGNTNTYVILKLPTILGSDFVMNNYSAPNIRAGVPAGVGKNIVPDPAYGWKVHWTWFDPKSKNPKNGTCEGSPNDVIIWTTDRTLLDIQRQVDTGDLRSRRASAGRCAEDLLRQLHPAARGLCRIPDCARRRQPGS